VIAAVITFLIRRERKRARLERDKTTDMNLSPAC
jgi:hypothetical protein